MGVLHPGSDSIMRDLKNLLLLFFLSIGSVTAQAQTDPLIQAKMYADQQDFRKAAAAYERLYEQSPLDQEVYAGYLETLLALKKYKDAEKLVTRQLTLRQHADPLLLIDQGRVQLAAGKEKKASEYFENAIALMTGEDMLTQRMVRKFTGHNLDQYTIKTYERAIELLRSGYLYSLPLARLYAKNNQIEEAVNSLLGLGPMQLPGMDDTKSLMLELLGNDPQKLQLTQKALIRKINEFPENPWYVDILTWLYIQKDDWEGAFIQMRALDDRQKLNGSKLLEFAGLARREGAYDAALKAVDAILEERKGLPVFAMAKAERLNVRMQQLQENPFFKPEDITSLQQEYAAFFEEFPQYYNTETLRDYALLEAQYANNPEKGIELLTRAVNTPSARKAFNGWAKLQLGDYYVLAGKIWDASLTYSQVDKEFREDMLGEEARFRNAKLAYYRGDFEWAQAQLNVLKASTSELIANDAMYLSVLITENIPPDSNLHPLRRFAFADLLLFQNKNQEAEQLLDSVATAFPDHPLNDDILMLRAKLAVKHREYQKALDYLAAVYDACKDCGKDDLLRDDALFQTAGIYEKYLKQPAQARKFYEMLILEYPGSTFVQSARTRLNELEATPPNG